MALIALGSLAAQVQSPSSPSPKTVKQDAGGAIVLLAIDASIDGTRARVEKKGDNPHNIGYWTNEKDKAFWMLDVVRPGKFEVEVEYSLDRRSEGSEYTIEFGDRSIDVKPKVTSTWLDFTRTNVGTIELAKPGVIKVIVRPTKKPGQAVLDLRAIRLRPVSIP